MRRMSATLLGLALALAGARLPGAESPVVQPIDDIAAAVVDFIESHPALEETEFEVRVGSLDPRLRLAACEEALAPFVPPGRRLTGNVAVGVRCDGDQPWTVYVPARVVVYRDVVVLNRSVAKGERVSDADVSLERRKTNGIARAYLTRLEEVVGMQARRTLTQGTVLGANMLAQPTLIRRGEQVVLLALAGAVEVRTAGRALVDGARGQVVRVRNARSRRVVEGVVVAEGVVQVRM